MGEITKREGRQLIRWTLTGVGSFFIYGYFNTKIKAAFPDSNAQLIIGVALLLIAAYMFNLTKYGG